MNKYINVKRQYKTKVNYYKIKKELKYLFNLWGVVIDFYVTFFSHICIVIHFLCIN